MFVTNLLLAFFWALLFGGPTAQSLTIGFVLGYLVLALLSIGDVYGTRRYVQRVVRVFGFVIYFLKELVLASLRIAYDVITPQYYGRPGVMALPLDARSDAEFTLLACCITLTPGTLSLEVSPDRRYLYIHVMYLPEPLQEARRQIKDGMERRLLEVLR